MEDKENQTILPSRLRSKRPGVLCPALIYEELDPDNAKVETSFLYYRNPSGNYRDFECSRVTPFSLLDLS